MRGVLSAAGQDLKDWLATYPPSSFANLPSNTPGWRWYERGYGPRWVVKDGSVHGRRTSQTLGRRWEVAVDPDGKRATVGNSATYAPYVQDQMKQPWFHAHRRWRTVQGAVREKGESIIRKVLEAVKELWDKS